MLNEYNQAQKRKEEYLSKAIKRKSDLENELDETNKKLKEDQNQNDINKNIICKHAKFLK